MLPETLCAGEATSPGPLIPSEVISSTSLSLEPWTLVQIITAPNIMDNLPHHFLLSACVHSLPHSPPSPHVPSPQYYPLIIPRDCCFPSCVFFSSLIHDIHARSYDPTSNTTTKRSITNPKEAATGADVKGVERLCRVETSEKVSRTLVTIPLPPLIRHGMGFP